MFDGKDVQLSNVYFKAFSFDKIKTNPTGWWGVHLIFYFMRFNLFSNKSSSASKSLG